MGAYKGKPPHLLSGGQKQRVAIAGVVARKPTCIIVDEPTAMLDPKGRSEIMSIISELHADVYKRQPIKGVNPDTGEEDVRHTSDTEPFSALAFKIMADPFVGKLAFFRVYSGTLQSGSYVYNLSLIHIW